MSITLELTPEQEARLRADAARNGKPLAEYALERLLGSSLVGERNSGRRTPSARDLLFMPAEERSAYLRAVAEDAASVYEADMALPPAQRELTALTALDGEPLHEYE